MDDTTTHCVACRGEPREARQGRLCDDCSNHLLLCLRHIETCYLALSAQPVHSGSERGAPGFASSSPARLDVVYEQDRRTRPELHTEQPGALAGIDDAVQMILCEQSVDPPRDTTMASLCNFLRQHHRWITTRPWVDEYATQLEQHRRRLRALTGLAPDRPVGTCLGVDCGGQVYSTLERDGVRCATCRRFYAGTDLLRFNAAQGVEPAQ